MLQKPKLWEYPSRRVLDSFTFIVMTIKLHQTCFQNSQFSQGIKTTLNHIKLASINNYYYFSRQIRHSRHEMYSLIHHRVIKVLAKNVYIPPTHREWSFFTCSYDQDKIQKTEAFFNLKYRTKTFASRLLWFFSDLVISLTNDPEKKGRSHATGAFQFFMNQQF